MNTNKIATNNGVLTIGEFRKLTAHLDDDTQIVTTSPDFFFNILGIELPDDNGAFAITLFTADTFDPRQF